MLAARRVSRAGGRGDPAAYAYAAAVGTPLTGGQFSAVSAALATLRATGVLAKLDMLQVYGVWAEDQVKDWALPSRTITTTGSPTFTARTGYVFNGTSSYVRTGFIPSAATVMTTSDYFIGADERTNVGAANARVMGSYNGPTQGQLLVPRNGSSVAQAGLSSATIPLATSVTTSVGLTCAQSSGTQGLGYKNGIVSASGAQTLGTANGALPTVEHYVGCYNSAGNYANGRAATVGYVVAGAGMTAEQHLSLYEAMTAFQTAATGL